MAHRKKIAPRTNRTIAMKPPAVTVDENNPQVPVCSPNTADTTHVTPHATPPKVIEEFQHVTRSRKVDNQTKTALPVIKKEPESVTTMINIEESESSYPTPPSSAKRTKSVDQLVKSEETSPPTLTKASKRKNLPTSDDTDSEYKCDTPAVAAKKARVAVTPKKTAPKAANKSPTAKATRPRADTKRCKQDWQNWLSANNIGDDGNTDFGNVSYFTATQCKKAFTLQKEDLVSLRYRTVANRENPR